ncbi:aldehyde dehydrogenase [Aspergillus pseudoustus]|uniref:aldehyde dehydrogenase (NAD(+)) n=1 Tax=Aspergillus pseudoustus TaxID=1810923 RepID=A0ABR4ILF4_9EURO
MNPEGRLFINNKYVPSSTGDTLTVINPADDNTVTEQVQAASPSDVDHAVACAKEAFKTWKKTPSKQRAAIMLKFADILEKHVNEVAKLESIAMGAPITLARRVVAGQPAIWRYYAGLIGKLGGEVFPAEEGEEGGTSYYRLVNYEPLGVCAGIAAWNGTQLFASWKIAPAVAAGNTVLFKSSEKSPLGVLYLGGLFREAGFPPGVINLLSGAGKVGAQLASHMDIAKISFTGSTAVGRKIQIAAAQSNLKIVSLELGGKSASLVFADANLENAVLHNSHGFLFNNAQVCTACSRILVQEDIAPKFVLALQKAFADAAQLIGDPALPSTVLGPLADKAQRDRVAGFVERAKQQGIEVLAGGGSGHDDGQRGQFFTPTILLNPDTTSEVYTDEIFGPVAVVKTFKSEEEGIALANDTHYGLAGAIFTSDVSRALRVASQIEAGTVGVNSVPMLSNETPFGGWKQSGYGRESGMHGLRGYLQTRTVMINTKA